MKISPIFSFFKRKPRVKTLEEKNKEFDAMIPCQKRIAIAQDVIAQVRVKRFAATPGTYVRMGAKYEDRITHKDKVEELLEIEGVQCNVCAKGALFMAHVMKTGNCDMSDANHTGTHSIAYRLKGVFDKDQLDMMESAFERSPFGSTSNVHAAVKFGKGYNNPDDRLIAIMENVIANRGDFKP